MKLQLSPRIVFRFLRFAARFTGTSLLEPDASKVDVISATLMWWFAVFNSVTAMFLFIRTLSIQRFNASNTMKTIAELMILTDTLYHLIVRGIKRNKIKLLVHQVSNFFMNAEDHEYAIAKTYFTRYAYFNIVQCCVYLSAMLVFMTSPLTTPKSLPLDIVYPFSTDPPIVHTFLYVHQIVIITHVGGVFVGDLMFTMLLLCATTKLKLLGEKFSRVQNETQLKKYIEEHQKIIGLIREAEWVVKHTLIESLITLSVMNICAGLQLIHEEKVTLISQFALIVLIGNLRLYGVAWPASDLTEASEKIGFCIYDSPWIEKSVKMRRTLTIIMVTSQVPLLITYRRLVILSLDFANSFNYLVISTFMTLKAIIRD